MDTFYLVIVNNFHYLFMHELIEGVYVLLLILKVCCFPLSTPPCDFWFSFALLINLKSFCKFCYSGCVSLSRIEVFIFIVFIFDFRD